MKTSMEDVCVKGIVHHQEGEIGSFTFPVYENYAEFAQSSNLLLTTEFGATLLQK